MTRKSSSADRVRQLVSQYVDGDLSNDDAAELNQLLRSEPSHAESVVDHLLLDSLLSEELGSESLGALVDLVAAPQSSPDRPPRPEASGQFPWLVRRRRLFCRRRLKIPITAVTTVAAAVLVAFVVGRWENRDQASAASNLRAAIETHARPVERVYLVQLDQQSADNSRIDAEFEPPRQVRVTTQGDRFYAEMDYGDRRWIWGRDLDGAMWLTVGPQQAIIVEQHELGIQLQRISNLYTLNLETLLTDVLQRCRLQSAEVTEATQVITATQRFRRGGFRKVTIDVDRETKAIRQLVIEKDFPGRGPSSVTFTLVESRAPDESRYRPEGHLAEPFRLLRSDMKPDQRREVLVGWFGRGVEGWIKTAQELEK